MAPSLLEADDSKSLRPFRAAFWFGGFNGLTWMVALGTPMVLMAEQLGASTFQVGLASSFVFLLLPVQVLSTVTLGALGFRRQMVIGWSARALFLLVPLGLAWTSPARPAAWMANALVASVFGFCLFRAFGSVAHLPWYAAILPDDLRGRFFATESAIVSFVGVGALLGCAALFTRLAAWDAFFTIYGVALGGSALAVWNLLRLPPGPRPRPTPVASLAREALRLCLQPGLFRHYLLLSLMGAVVTSSLGAFTAYYLKVEAGLESSRILSFTAAQFLGQIAGTWSIRRFIDGAAIRRFFQATQVGIGLFDLFWLALVTGTTGLVALLPAAYFVFGLAAGISNTAHFTYLPVLSSDDGRPVAIAVFTATLGLFSGLGPSLWGLALRAEAASPGVDRESFALFFGLGVVLCVVLVLLFRRLPDVRRADPRAAPAPPAAGGHRVRPRP